jgi:citrate lyase subunit beta / citryl-CoA lyase
MNPSFVARAARSWLFVPAHKQAMIDKALGLGVDAIILDLEDGVPESGKTEARANIARVLATTADGPALWVRVHPTAHPAFTDDMACAAHAGLSGLVLAKTETPADLKTAEQTLERFLQTGQAPANIGFIAAIESARALLQSAAIATASVRLQGLLFGAEDFALDMGMPVGVGSEHFAYARSVIAVAAAAAGVAAIDRVFLDVRDAAGLQADARAARSLGFSGKCLIHPSQIAVNDAVFAPTEGEMANARRIVDAFAKSGEAVSLVDGKMVDAPVVERARRVLLRAKDSAK